MNKAILCLTVLFAIASQSANASATINAASVEFGYTGGEGVFNVSGKFSTARVVGDWLSVESETNEILNGTIRYLVATNTLLADRIGKIVATPASGSSQPVKFPESVNVHHYSLEAVRNGFAVPIDSEGNEISKTAGMSFWTYTADRTGLELGAVKSNGEGRFVVENFSNMFSGNYLSNHGMELSYEQRPSENRTFWRQESTLVKYRGHSDYTYLTNQRFFPYPIAGDWETNATYVVWLRIDRVPDSEVADLMVKKLESGEVAGEYGGVTNLYVEGNSIFAVRVSKDLSLIIDQNGITNRLENSAVPLGEWFMLSLVGESQRVVSVYLNEKLIATIPTENSFGYVPPTDGRCMSQGWFLSGWRAVPVSNMPGTFYYTDEWKKTYNIIGGISNPSFKMVIGGWCGALDDVSIYHEALNAQQISDLYSAKSSKEQVLTVSQRHPAIRTDPPEIVLDWSMDRSSNVTVECESDTEYSASSLESWLQCSRSSEKPMSLYLYPTDNQSVYERRGAVKIGDYTISVRQLGCPATLDSSCLVANEVGGDFQVYVDLNPYVSRYGYTFYRGPISSGVRNVPEWITPNSQSTICSGPYTEHLHIDPLPLDLSFRSVMIEIAGCKFHVAQRRFGVSVEDDELFCPSFGTNGTISISVPQDSEWTARSADDWIVVDSKWKRGESSVTFRVDQNDANFRREGKIYIAGEEVTIVQSARDYSVICTNDFKLGTVSGVGRFEFGSTVTLTASPDAGCKFDRWSGDIVSTKNPLEFTVGGDLFVAAEFSLSPIEELFISGQQDGVIISWKQSPRVSRYDVYRYEDDGLGCPTIPTIPMASVANNSQAYNMYWDDCVEPEKNYVYWIKAVSGSDSVVSAPLRASRLLVAVDVAIEGPDKIYVESLTKYSLMVLYNDGKYDGGNRVNLNWKLRNGGDVVKLRNVDGQRYLEVLPGADMPTNVVLRIECGPYAWEKKIAVCARLPADIALNCNVVSDYCGWLVEQSSDAHDGEYAMRSGLTENYKSTELYLDVNGPGTLRFWWRVIGDGVLSFQKLTTEYYGGVGREAWYTIAQKDSTNWMCQTFAITSKDKRLRWSYLPRSGGLYYGCYGVIDEVSWSAEYPDLGASPTLQNIKDALMGTVDECVSANITNAEMYSEFCAWAKAVKSCGGKDFAGVQAVKSSPHSWLSFALGSETLIDKIPTNGQMRIEKFEPASSASLFNFMVGIDEVVVGSDATENNLKKVFGIEGGVSLDALSSTNIDLFFGTPKNGKIIFTAGPNAKNADAKTFFMKVKQNP